MESPNPTQYLLVGYPFAGKTTLAKELEKRLGFVYLSVDEVKAKQGYEGVSEDDVPDAAWDSIFNELHQQIIDALTAGKTVVTEYAWVTKAWRDRARKLSANLGLRTKIIWVKTPEQIVRQRLVRNRKTRHRFDHPDTVFEDAIRTFEEPYDSEEVIVYDASMDLNDWIDQNFAPNNSN